MKLVSKSTVIPLTLLSIALVGCRKAETEAEAPAEETHTAITTDALEPYECGSITRLHTYAGVFLASQPTPEDFAQAQKGGVVTVINMRHADEVDDFDEKQVVEDLGLTYHNPAWNGVEELTDAVIDEVRGLLSTAERPILLHCSSGNRVGAIWMAYRILDDGVDIDAAVEEAKIVGMKSPAYEERVRDYIAATNAG